MHEKSGRRDPHRSAGAGAAFFALLAVAGLLTGCETKLRTLEIVAAPALPRGTSAQLQALGTYHDGSQRDLTALLTWSSDNPAAVTISDEPGHKGLVTARGAGGALITGSYDGLLTTAELHTAAPLVTALAITPPSPVIARGTIAPLTATGTMSDGTTQDATALVTWTSRSPTIADFTVQSGRKGVVQGVAAGAVVLVATWSGVSARVSLVVKDATLVALALTPVRPTLAAGTTQQLVATGTFSDQTTQDVSSLVTWTSSDFSVVTVSNAGASGLCTAVAKGSVNVSATLRGVSGTTALTVSDASLVAIGVTPPAATLVKGTTQQFVATGTYSDGTTQELTSSVVWTVGNSAAASILNDVSVAGLGAALAAGASTVIATLEGKSGSANLVVAEADLVTITLTPNNATIAQGTTQKFVATGVYSDGSTQDLSSNVTWSSSASAVVAISNADGSRGLSSGIARGAAMISASFGEISGSTAFTISDATLNTLVITPASATLASGTTTQLTALGQYSDGTTQDLTTAVCWGTSNQDVAQISSAAGSAGLATAMDKGTTAVSATFAGITGTATLRISDATLTAITITPKTLRLSRGSSQQFVAAGTFSDGTTQELTRAVTWSSSDPAVAAISNAADSKGMALGEALGQTILVASWNGISKSTAITVN